jgi:hypothetical protein
MRPDAELIFGAYLRDHETLEALDARVASQRPGDASRPWVRYTQLDAPSRSGRTDYFLEYMVQFDSFPAKGEGIAEASLLNRTVREALRQMPDDADGALADQGVVVSGVEFVGDARQLDTTVEPAQPFYALTALIWAHANGGGA